MNEVVASISISVDGYIAGPDDRPGQELGVGGERLHYWIFGGPWTYGDDQTTGATGVDRHIVDEWNLRSGAVIGGRTTYDIARAWGGKNPWENEFFIVTHRPSDVDADPQQFTFVDGFQAALDQARAKAGDKNVHIMGGANVLRQALEAGVVDELMLSVAPVVLGGGKRLFDGFARQTELQLVQVVQSPWATHLRYRIHQ